MFTCNPSHTIAPKDPLFWNAALQFSTLSIPGEANYDECVAKEKQFESITLLCRH